MSTHTDAGLMVGVFTGAGYMYMKHITETVIIAQQAFEDGMFDGHGDWFKLWAAATNNDPVYVYHFGGVYGGFVYGTPAIYSTLVEFDETADDVCDIIWREFMNELDSRDVREFLASPSDLIQINL